MPLKQALRCSVALLVCAASVSSQPTVVVPISTVSYGAWEGIGVSLAWWANVWGSSAALADVVFSCQAAVSVPGIAAPLPGLCMNIARYNLGGSSNTSAYGASIVYSPSIPWWKQIQGFWLDYASDDPSSASFDWSRDANQRAMLLAAKARGADTFEMFSNTPMWWMLNNHNPSGSADGTSDNLQPWNIANHSKYVAIAAAHFASAWNLSFASLELFNEPIAGWWKADGTQEGCHFEVATQAAALEALPAQLAARGLAGHLRVAASDESRIDMALATWAALPAAAKQVIDQVNVHGYQDGGDRAGLYQAAVVAGGKVLRDSEYGDGDGSGGTLISSFLADWSALHPLGWCYWQIVDVASGWGLLLGDADAGALSAANTKHFVVAQLSRHLRPGMATLGTLDARNATAAALDVGARRLVVITANQAASPADVRIDLAAFAAAPAGAVAAWLTSTASATPDPTAAHTPLTGVVVAADKTVAISLPAWGVVTLEIDGVRLT